MEIAGQGFLEKSPFERSLKRTGGMNICREGKKLRKEGRKEGISGGFWKATELLLIWFLCFLPCVTGKKTDPVCHADTTCLLSQVHWFDVCSSKQPSSSSLSDSRPPFPSNPKFVQAHPPYPEQLSPGPQISGREWGGVFKCAVFWVSATSVCADPQATSCMKSSALRKHPSHRRRSLTLHRKLSGCMHAHTIPASISYKVYKSTACVCVLLLFL